MNGRGFTIVELIGALAVASILIYLALPAYSDLIRRMQTTSRVNGIIGLVRFARETAVTQRRWITLCPALGEECVRGADWHRGIMVFADLNRNGSREAEEPVVAYQSALKAGERLTWRSFRQRNYLQFRTEGYTNWQNGSFLYCPETGDARFGKVIIVNIQGRATPSTDQDGDGVDEQADGRPLTC